MFISNRSASFIDPKSSLKFANSFLGFTFGLGTWLTCFKEKYHFIYEAYSLHELLLATLSYIPWFIYFLILEFVVLMSVSFLLFPLLQNGTKDSISKLVSELNAATLETDVGKPICFIFTYPSLPLSRIFPCGAMHLIGILMFSCFT